MAGPAETTTTTLPLSETAEELVDRLAAARQRDLHLVFVGALPDVPDGKLTLEVWWQGERARQALIAEAPQERQESTAFVLPDGNVFCQRTQAVDWACQRAASTATAAGQPAGIIEALVAELNGKDVTVAEAKVGEEDADCYTLDPASGNVLCVRGDGIPVKFSFSGAELVITEVDTEVAGDAFDPPASVEPPSASPPTVTSKP